MEDVQAGQVIHEATGISWTAALAASLMGTHFVITCTTSRFGEVNVWKVVDEKGGFRQPDQRELDILQESPTLSASLLMRSSTWSRPTWRR